MNRTKPVPVIHIEGMRARGIAEKGIERRNPHLLADQRGFLFPTQFRHVIDHDARKFHQMIPGQRDTHAVQQEFLCLLDHRRIQFLKMGIRDKFRIN